MAKSKKFSKNNECSVSKCRFKGVYCGRARGEKTVCFDCPIQQEQIIELSRNKRI